MLEAMDARIIDHLVLPVPLLVEARVRLSRLGFTVAADGHHPFGTQNACIFLKDGVYLEPLAIGDKAVFERSIDAGNAFTVRHRSALQAYPDCGLSAIVIASDDAEADDRRFRKTGLGGGDIVDFSRCVRLPDGGEKIASFRLAFAVDDRFPEFFAFACQRIASLPHDLAGLASHANGVVGLKEVLLCQSGAISTQRLLLEAALETETVRGSDGSLLNAGNCVVRILEKDIVTPSSHRKKEGEGHGSCGHAIVFAVEDLAVTEATLAANDVPFSWKGNRLSVERASGQDVVFAFEE